MTTVWTDIAKPSGNAWTDIAKPSAVIVSSTLTIIGGTPIGLLLSLTQSSVIGVTSIVTSKWTDVSKNATNWTDVPKAT